MAVPPTTFTRVRVTEDLQVDGGIEFADGTVGTLTNDTVGTTPEDAYITVTIEGVAYKIPAWLDNA